MDETFTATGFKGVKATSELQDNGIGILHQAAQSHVDQVYLYTWHPCSSLPMQDLEEQGTGCRTGRPVWPYKNFLSLAQRGS